MPVRKRSLKNLRRYEDPETYTYTKNNVTYRQTDIYSSVFFSEKLRHKRLEDALRVRNQKEEGLCEKIYKWLSPR